MTTYTRAELERRIYQRVLVECRFGFHRLMRGDSPQQAAHIVDQINLALSAHRLPDDELQRVAVAVHAIEP